MATSKEELGLLLLKSIAAVAPVPRPEDVGIDAVAPLLRIGPKGLLFAENSFYVQLKSDLERVIDYAGNEVRVHNPLHVVQLIELDRGLFLGWSSDRIHRVGREQPANW